MTEADWAVELRLLAAQGLDIVQIIDTMQERHPEFRHRSILMLNQYRIAFDLSIRQMQDIGGYYEGGLSADFLRSEINLQSSSADESFER